MTPKYGVVFDGATHWPKYYNTKLAAVNAAKRHVAKGGDAVFKMLPPQKKRLSVKDIPLLKRTPARAAYAKQVAALLRKNPASPAYNKQAVNAAINSHAKR